MSQKRGFLNVPQQWALGARALSIDDKRPSAKKEEKEQNCDFENNGNVWKIHNQEDKIDDLKIKWENKRKQA